MTIFRPFAAAVLASTILCTALAADERQTIDLSYQKPLDVQGRPQRLSGGDRHAGSVFVFLSSECPISRQYIPELNRLAKALPNNKIAFYGVISDHSLTRTAAIQFVKDFQISFPVLFDSSRELARLFGPERLPESFLLDPHGAVVYRGRIDDLYADITKRRTEPKEHDLLRAMTSLAEGKPIAVARTQAVGCAFESATKSGAAASVTYSRDVAPILFAHCAECHRPGEVAPFSLLTYQDAAKRSKFLAEVTAKRVMPPWKADIQFSHFLDERRLTDSQIALLKAWSAAGAPEGDAADLPPQPKFPTGWRLGEPDVVAKVPVAFTVPASGPDIFQHFVIPIDIPKDQTIVGIEFRPGNASVVHHAVIFLDSTGRSRLRDAQTPEPGWRTSGSIDASVTSMLGVWTPGMTPRFYPESVGIPVDKGTDVVVQLHLHPSGKEESDQSRIGIYFAKTPVKKTMSRNPLLLGTLVIEIPPGKTDYHTGSSVTLPVDLTLSSVFPHMHLIGKQMKVTATAPDGKVTPLIWIKDWSFYWQDAYVYPEPLRLTKGTRIAVEATYDNSASNPFNPSSPPKRVLFGNDSTDEMCFAIFQTVADDTGSARKMGGSMMRSFMSEWNSAPLSPDARVKIMAEAMKLFGGGRGMRRPAPAPATKPGGETKTSPQRPVGGA